MSVNNLRDRELRLALHLAVMEMNNLSGIQRLLDLGADVNAGDVCNEHFTALHVAAQCDYCDSHLSNVENLLKNGADVNAKDFWGNSVLHYLVRHNNLKTIELLLNLGADVNMKNIRHETPLCHALCESEFETVKLLIDRGADVKFVDKIESTSLHHVFKGQDDILKKIKFLLKKGANIDAINDDGYTPFHMMVMMIRFTDERLFKFFFKYASILPVKFAKSNILCLERVKEKGRFWKIILEYVAKFLKLDLTVDPSIFESISRDEKYKDYLSKCLKELEVAKSTKFNNCWVTYFNLLVENKIKLKNYAGNQDLIQDFNESDCFKKFPIYGTDMIKNVEKGIERRKLFDESTEALSNCLPIFSD